MWRFVTGLFVGMILCMASVSAWLAFHPHLWLVWAIPLISAFVFQVIALTCGRAKIVFWVADWLSDLVIGAVIGVGSIYVLYSADFNRFISLQERQSLTWELTSVKQSIPSVARQLNEQMAVPRPDEEFLKSCLSKALQGRVPNSRTDRSPVAEPDLCKGYAESLARGESLQREHDRLVRRQNEIPGRIAELEKVVASSSSPTASFRELTLRFVFIPTLVLMGFAAKLGKATYSFREQ